MLLPLCERQPTCFGIHVCERERGGEEKRERGTGNRKEREREERERDGERDREGEKGELGCFCKPILLSVHMVLDNIKCM